MYMKLKEKALKYSNPKVVGFLQQAQGLRPFDKLRASGKSTPPI